MSINFFPLDMEGYLREALEDGTADFCVQASKDSEGQVKFIIRPFNKEGMALDFCVRKNNLITVVYQRSPKDLGQEVFPS